MKAVIVPKPGAELEIWDVPDPKIGDYDVLVEQLTCGVCASTDREVMDGHFPGVDHYPTALGHEAVGRVVEMGPKVRNFKMDDLVLHAQLPKVEGDRDIGSAWGAYAEFGVATDGRAMLEDGYPDFNDFYLSQQALPADMDPVEGTLLITLKETLSGLQQFGVAANSSLLIFGDGPVGACLIRFAKLVGARPVVVAGHHDDRLQIASRMGADYVINTAKNDLKSLAHDVAPEGLDYIIDAVGRNELMNQALPLLKNHGKFCIYGVASTQHLNFDWSEGPYHWTIEHMIFPTFPIEAATHGPILDWIRLGFIEPRSLVSHVFGMDEISRVFELIERREVFKGVIQIKN